jgi:hypothetical protein
LPCDALPAFLPCPQAWNPSSLRIEERRRGLSQAYSPLRGSIWFSGALLRASWSQGRLWALLPASGGVVPARAVTRPLNTTAAAACNTTPRDL